MIRATSCTTSDSLQFVSQYFQQDQQVVFASSGRVRDTVTFKMPPKGWFGYTQAHMSAKQSCKADTTENGVLWMFSRIFI